MNEAVEYEATFPSRGRLHSEAAFPEKGGVGHASDMEMWPASPVRGGRTTGDGAFLVPEESARQLSVQVAQLGRIVAVLARRMEDMEAQNARLITVSHAQALQLGKLIRGKAQSVAQRYGLPADSEKKIRAAIKKELLTRIGVRDLHDTPLAAWDRAAGIIDGWSNIGLIMEMRKSKNG